MQHVLRFYCKRYLGISLQRDGLSGGRDRARRCFDEAKQALDSIPDSSVHKAALLGRLYGNYGNLALDDGEWSRAINFYSRSHKIFNDANDLEHIRIAQLQIAQARIAQAEGLDGARVCLDVAESIFISLG